MDGQSFQQLTDAFISQFETFDESREDFAFGAFDGIVPQFSTLDSGPTSNTTAGLFDFTVAAFDGTVDDVDQSVIDDIIAVTTAALGQLADFIVGATGAVLDVAVTIATQGPSTVASASAGSLFIGGDVNGFTEILAGSQIELITGTDPNGADADVNVTVNADFFLGANAFTSTDPNRIVPAGQIDFVSVLTHEILHGLGFFAFRDNTGEDVLIDLGAGAVAIESTFGTNVTFADEGGLLTPRFFGQNVVDVYGEGLTLESTFNSAGSDISHAAAFNPDGSLADTALALENPSVIPGDLVTVGALELSFLQDLGFNITIPSDLGLVNELDGLPFTPTVSVEPEVTIVNGERLVTIS